MGSEMCIRDSNTLDTQIAAACRALTNQRLIREIDVRSEQLQKESKRLRGRQMLRLIYEMYRTGTRHDYYYNILDLSKLQLRNDDLLAFKQQWDDMLTRVDPNDQRISDNMLGIVMERAIEHSSRMKEDFARYRRLPEGHSDRNYRWLYCRMTDEIDRKDRVANRATVQRATGGGDVPAAAAAKGTGKVKTNARAKKKADAGPDDRRAPVAATPGGAAQAPEAGRSRRGKATRLARPSAVNHVPREARKGSPVVREEPAATSGRPENVLGTTANTLTQSALSVLRPKASPPPPAVPARFASSFKQDVAPSGHDASTFTPTLLRQPRKVRKSQKADDVPPARAGANGRPPRPFALFPPSPSPAIRSHGNTRDTATGD